MREMKDSGIEWIGEIPKSWTITILSALFSERKCKNSGLVENNLLSLSYGNIVRKNIESNEGLLPASFETYNIIEPGNIVFRLTDLQNDKRSLRTGLCKERGIITSAYVTLQIRSDDSPRYMHYLFHTYDLCKVFYGMGDGVRQGMNYEDLKRLRILRPDQETQRRIADYLDRKCSQIDAIITRQQEVIEKLKAYKLSVITEAVTKGLNPDVSMKDSGVEWIGEIPEHWQVPKIKCLATIASGGTPDRSHPEYWNGSINWAKTGELQNNELYETEEKITELALENSSAKVFSVDTILVAMYGQGKTRGMTALLKVPSATNQACAGIAVYSKDITVSYLWLFLMGAYDAIREKANGSGQPNLSGALIADFNVTLPPIEEQMNICKTVAMRLPHIDSIIKQKETIVDKLTAYKKSLIYEVVTGKKEV